MRYLLIGIVLLINLVAFSQEKKTVKSGYITFNSGTLLEFKNLTIDGENVMYLSGDSQQETKVSIKGVRKIVDSSGATIYNSGKASNAISGNKVTINEKPVALPKTEQEKLVYRSAYKLTMDGKKLTGDEVESLLKPSGLYDDYKKQRGNATLGDILMGGGIGLFIGGGISNISKANNDEGGGSPAILIAGLITTAIGIPVKISATKRIKNVVNHYNSLPANSTGFYDRAELKIIGSSNGVGFQVRF